MVRLMSTGLEQPQDNIRREEMVKVFEEITGVSAKTVRDGSVRVQTYGSTCIVTWEGVAVLSVEDAARFLGVKTS